MKRLFALFAFFACTSGAAASTVEDAIKSREDLSVFYRLLVGNGVLEGLDSGIYTIFAPTNEAFANLPENEYPCLYAFTCQKEAAVILRNHFVENEQYLGDVIKKKAGVFADSNLFISIAEVQHDEYTANGNKVLSTHGLLGGILYKIDGVLADNNQLYKLQRASDRPAQAPEAPVEQPPSP